MGRSLSIALVALACLVTAVAGDPAAASTPPLRGAATHPLWSNSTPEDFDRELDLLARAGANTVRVDLGWSTLEQEGKDVRADWYVEKADLFFAHARARGLRPIVTFWSTPCWASSAPEELKQGCEGAWWDRGVHTYPPVDPADLADAAAWVAERWGDDMAAIEIWNEPNLRQFFTSPDPAGDYAPMLKAAYARVKQVKPDLPVLGPAMVMSDGLFLEALYAKGVAGHFDGLSLRPFNQGRDPYDGSTPSAGRKYSYLLGVPWIREIMSAHGDAGKRMWFTELGFSSCAPGTNPWCITEDLQARYVADALRIARDRWDFVESISVYNLRNKGTNPTDRETQMGLVHRDFTPKPAYWAFRDVLAEPPSAALPPGGESAPAAPMTPGVPLLGPVPVSTTPDRTPPVLTLLSARTGPRRRSAVLSFRLTEPADAYVRLQRSVRRRRCRTGCLRWVSAGAPVRGPADAGINRLRLGLPGAPGRYRVTAYARDGAANRSRVQRVALSAPRVGGRGQRPR
ncbi:MAG: cellulase family glycosylhydrolase, partial [Thermoleophilaceae bacterium]|nr:cellulase family glycosylhydrolase [Thermoleophilaceae bacterium]